MALSYHYSIELGCYSDFMSLWHIISFMLLLNSFIKGLLSYLLSLATLLNSWTNFSIVFPSCSSLLSSTIILMLAQHCFTTYTNKLYLTSILNNIYLIHILSFSFGTDHTLFQLSINLQIRISLFYNKLYKVPNNNFYNIQQTWSICSSLFLKRLFLYLRIIVIICSFLV